MPRKIIVFEFFFIGDLIMAVPALRALRKRYPDAKITLLAPRSAAELANLLPWVDEIVTFHCPWSSHQYGYKAWLEMYRLVKKLRLFEWDLAIELRGDLPNILLAYMIGAHRRVSFAVTGGEFFLTDVVPYDDTYFRHQVEGNLEVVRYLGCDVSHNLPELKVDDDSDRLVLRVLKEMKRPVIGIHPCASKANKMWQTQKWGELIIQLIEKYQATVLILYGPSLSDRNIAQEIHSRTCLNDRCFLYSRPLPELVALIHRLDLLIALDSAASHVAAAVHTPVITLFGPQSPDLARPYHFMCRVIIKEGLNCRPCGTRCLYKDDNRCMKMIEIEDVLGNVTHILTKHTAKCSRDNPHTVVSKPG